MRLTLAVLATSASTAIACAPLAAHSAATVCALRLSAMTSRAPSSAKSSAVARPMPEPPPVMMQTLSFRRMFLATRILDPAQNVTRDGNQHAVLIDDADVGERLTLLRIDFGDGVGERNRVSDEHRSEEAHAIIAQRHRRRLQRGALAFLDHHRRARRHVTDNQRAMGDAPAEFRTRHVLLVDVVHREIAGNPGKEIDVGLSDRLGEGHAVPDVDENVLHYASQNMMRSLLPTPRPSFVGRLSKSIFRLT